MNKLKIITVVALIILLDLSILLASAHPLQRQDAEAMSAFSEIYVDPARTIDLSMGPGSTFSVNVTLVNVTSLGACAFNLTYDPQVLEWVGFDILPAEGEYPRFVFTANTSAGFIWMSLYYLTPITVSSSTPLTRLRFNVNSYGISTLNLFDIELLDQYGNTVICDESDGLFANIIRDVAVTNVVPAFNWVYQTWVDDINVTMANLGNVTENFTITALYNSTVIGTSPVASLAPSAQATVTIPWNTTGVPAGNYAITGTASLVPYETYFNTANNVYVDGVVQVLLLTQIRDVEIANVTAPRYWAYQGESTNITVTAENDGQVVESFNVMVFYDAILMGNVSVNSLASGATVNKVFTLNTTGLTLYHNYTISGQASIVPFEFNVSNNFFADGYIAVRLGGDVTGDGQVTGDDLIVIAAAFASYGPGGPYFMYPGAPASSRWSPLADINGDNMISGDDLIIAARNFGQVYPLP